MEDHRGLVASRGGPVQVQRQPAGQLEVSLIRRLFWLIRWRHSEIDRLVRLDVLRHRAQAAQIDRVDAHLGAQVSGQQRAADKTVPEATDRVEAKRGMPVAVLVTLRIDARAVQPFAVLPEALGVEVLSEGLHDTRVEIGLGGGQAGRGAPLDRAGGLCPERRDPGHQVVQVRDAQDVERLLDPVGLSGGGMAAGRRDDLAAIGAQLEVADGGVHGAHGVWQGIGEQIDVAAHTPAGGDGEGVGQAREHGGEGGITGRAIQVEHDQVVGHRAADDADVVQQPGLAPGVNHIKRRWFDLVLGPGAERGDLAFQGQDTESYLGVGQGRGQAVVRLGGADNGDHFGIHRGNSLCESQVQGMWTEWRRWCILKVSSLLGYTIPPPPPVTSTGGWFLCGPPGLNPLHRARCAARPASRRPGPR